MDLQAQAYRHAWFACAPVLWVHSKILTAANLLQAFQDYLETKNDLPTVSEHRDTGLGNLNDLAQLALQV